MFKRAGNPKLKLLFKTHELKGIHVVRAEGLMQTIFDLHIKFPCDESLVVLRRWMTDNQKSLYSMLEGRL
jgi:hypothetical protein